jgi:tetratricopeptide (TPR) repeat protein
MKHSVFVFASALMIVGSTGSSLRAQDLTPLPEPIAPPQTLPALPEPIGAAPVANAPLKGIKNRVADEREAIKASAELVLPRLLKRELTVAEAWEKKLIRAPHIEYLLGEYLNIWGGFTWAKWGGVEWADEVALRRGLAKQLISHWEQSAPEKLQTTNLLKLNPRVRLWVTDYLQSVKDEKTVAVAESLVSQFPAVQAKTNLKDEQSLANFETLVFQTCERLAWYYSGKEEYLKAAEAWLKVETLLPEQSRKKWFVPDSLLEAARRYAKSGQMEKAEELYNKVASYGDSWLTGLAYSYHARDLISRERYAEARKLLQQSVEGGRADEVKVEMLTTLSYSYYRAGEFSKARQYGREAISQYKSLSNPTFGSGIEGAVNMAEGYVSGSERWEKTPLFCYPNELNITLDLVNNSKNITSPIVLQSLREIPLTLSVDNPHVKVVLGDKGYDAEHFFHRRASIEIAADVRNDFDTSIMISSSRFPDFKISLPVHVRIKNPIQAVPQTNFFGFVKAGQTVTKTLQLHGEVPFRINKVEPSDSTLQIDLDSVSNVSTQHSLKLKFSPKDGEQIYQGHVRIFTDLPAQKVIEVPCVAQVK